ncbi:MAG TPA: lmo0937 family membrane protein [Chthonomonadaceae bacterium]|nr:lmo0937 family membrane protein [Chthonomonadaceae bacterium]
MANLLWTIITVLFVLWLAGLILHFGGWMIHMVLVVAAILFVVNLFTRGTATTT